MPASRLPMHDKRHEQGEASRSAIIESASRLMAKHGFDAASVSMIAKDSGLPASSIYWHFESKDGLFAAVMKAGAERFFASFPDLDGIEGTPAERLRFALMTTAGSLATVPEYAQFLRLQLRFRIDLDHHPRDAVFYDVASEVREGGVAFMRGLIAAAYRPGAPRLADTLAAEFAELGVAIVDGVFVAMQVADGEPAADDAILQRGVDALVAAVESRRAELGG